MCLDFLQWIHMTQQVSILRLWALPGCTNRHSRKIFSKKLTLCNIEACHLSVDSNVPDIVLLAKMMHVSFISITWMKSLEQVSQFYDWCFLGE